MQILIIDDEKVILDLTSIILKNRGHKVTTATDYYYATQVMDECVFDVIITDSVINGELCKPIISKSATLNPKPAVLIMAGVKNSEHIVVELMKEGAYDYIIKPFNNQDLAERIERAYGHKKLLDEIDILRRQIGIENSQSIIRSIEFEPEYYQAGLTILTYFNTIVNQKYPGIKVKVKIEQEDKIVRMIIETPEGEKEKIEKTLEQYGLILKGDLSPEAFLSNPFEVMALKNKLELVGLELRQSQALYRVCEQKNTERINALENQVMHLQYLVAEGLKGVNKSADLLFKMFDNYLADNNIKYDLQTLLHKIEAGLSISDEEEVKAILTKLHSANHGILSDLKDFALSTVTGVSGNFLYSWILSLLASVPK